MAKKHKTKKIFKKRLKITTKGKILRRPTRQDHFNAGEPADKTRKKRKIKPIKNKSIKKLVKYYI